MSFTWQNGRQLAGISKDGLTASYAYNDSGTRLRKTVNGVATQYFLNGSMIVAEVTGDVQTDYYYDESGNVFGFKRGNSEYYYIRNGQGDIIGILDSSGTQIVSYVYDSWGKLVSVTDASGNDKSGDASFIGNLNPFRYRGYYYDTEIGLYYVSSRYYDPEAGRFINADTTDILTTTPLALTDKNLFAYCDNNPVVRKDSSGKFWLQLGATIVGGLISAGMELGSQLASGKKLSEVNWKSVAIEGASGAATGLLMSIGVPAPAVTAGRAVINAATSVAHSINEGDELAETVVKATTSATITMVAGNAKTVGNRLTQGRHAKLGKVGNFVRNVTYEPRHAKPNYMGAVIGNRFIRGSSRIISRNYRTYSRYW